MTDAEVRRPVLAWVWGGGLLVGSAAVPALAGGAGYAVLGWLQTVLFAAAMVVFAIGWRGEGSVVGRRMPGIVALCAVAVILPLLGLVTAQVFVVDPADPTGVPDWAGAAQVVNLAGLAVWAAAALVAAVEVVRARIVPDPWRFAPLWALGALVVVFVATQVIVVSGGGGQDATVLAILWSAVSLLVPLALGILALALGARGRALPNAQVYPPAPPAR